MFLAYGVGGLVGPILGGYMGDLRLWEWAFIPAGIACFLAAAVAWRLTPPRHPSTVSTGPRVEGTMPRAGAGATGGN